MVEELLAYLPQTGGTILEISDGMLDPAGTQTAACLAGYYGQQDIYSLAGQVPDDSGGPGASRQLARRQFERNSLAAESLDNALYLRCFGPGALDARLLKSLFRAMKPGGRFVGFETLPRPPAEPRWKLLRPRPFGAGALKSLLRDAGFEDIALTNVTARTLRGFERYKSGFYDRMYLTKAADMTLLNALQEHLRRQLDGIGECVFFTATRPGTPGTGR